MRKIWFLHPFLFVLYPALFLFSRNIDEVCVSDALLLVALIETIAVFVFIVVRHALRSSLKAACILSLMTGVFFIYRFVYEACNTVMLVQHRVLLPAMLGLCAAGIYALARTRRDLTGVSRFLTLMGVFMIVIPLVGIGRCSLQPCDSSPAGVSAVDTRRPDAPPDIYYLVLDGYVSALTLRDVFGYDNGEFMRYLRAKGFYIAQQSFSNYSMTFRSLSSSLNMGYVRDIDETCAENDDNRIFYRLIRENAVARMLKEYGYTYIHFGTQWGPTSHSPYADSTIRRYPWLNEFLMVFIRSTMLMAVYDRLMTGFEREDLLYTFDGLEEIARREGPKFVFAHILAPHQPFIFGSGGERVPYVKPFPETPASDQAYLSQLRFVNARMVRIVDAILERSARPPVIILQADHGWQFSSSEKAGREALIRHTMGILNAYYLPGGDAGLYPGITPVNSFRVVFSRYFACGLEVLPDKSYFISREGDRFDLRDVTEVLKESD